MATRRAALWLRAKQHYGLYLRRFVRRTFHFWERLGLHLTQNHYYEPVPDTRKLPARLWEGPSEMVGIDMREETQLTLLASFAERFRSEYEALPRERTEVAHQFYINNGGFPSIDAEALYCMVRSLRPRRIIEVGSGNSTLLAAQALTQNLEGNPQEAGELIAIEPYPGEVLVKGFPGLTRLMTTQVQEVPLAEFQSLGQDDILFIDSSHMLKIGSDVHYEYLELLPRLRAGVVVHIHDIHFPMEYPQDLVLDSRRFWNEQYLLQAFLSFNDAFEILWAGNYLHMRHPDALAAAFTSYNRAGRWPSSLWMRKVR